MRSLPLIMLLAACGGPRYRAQTIESNEMSSTNRKCGYNAARTEERSQRGDRMTYWLPCWDDDKRGARYAVPHDVATRAQLAKVSAAHCIGLFPQAIERSPFAQREAIQEIVPHRFGTSLVGVHIVFKPIPGLTVSWMRRAIECHQARWETLGRPAGYLSGDPTLVEGAAVTVSESDHRVVVLVETQTETGTQLVLRRANDLIASRFPVRTPGRSVPGPTTASRRSTP
jgi:hypothetical protein